MSTRWQPPREPARRAFGLRLGHTRGRNPVLLTAPVSTIPELARAISVAVFGLDRPAPTNLDGLADLLREARVAKVVACDWRLDARDSQRVAAVFRDNGVRLSR